MIRVREAAQRGQTNTEWLESYHSFSFNNYYDPAQLGFRSLRVINEDLVKPGSGFPTHSHRDMEILTYVLSGALEHRDSMGNGSVIRPGEIQAMSAGRGVSHSEFNHSQNEAVHLLQIWILPRHRNNQPGYQQRTFPIAAEPGRWHRIAASVEGEPALQIDQDVELYATRLTAGAEIEYQLSTGRAAWLQVARGSVQINGVVLKNGDGAAISDEQRLLIQADQDAELLLFDLA